MTKGPEDLAEEAVRLLVRASMIGVSARDKRGATDEAILVLADAVKKLGKQLRLLEALREKDVAMTDERKEIELSVPREAKDRFAAERTMCECYWQCEHCGRSGRFSHEDDASVYTVIDLLKHEHDHSTEKESCTFDLYGVRVSKMPTTSSP